MEANDYASYDLALKLKACGFDGPCDKCFKIIPGTEREEWDEEECQWCTVQDVEYYPKITLWQAQKWLREKKHLSVEPYANIVANFNYNIADLESFADYKGHYEGQGIGYESYECALAAGLFAALELIKNGE